MQPRRSFVLGSLALLLAACGGSAASSPTAPAPAPAFDRSAPAAFVPKEAPREAAIDAPAPDFELPDLDGHKVRLSSFRGKTVVLEWFNPECPFVRHNHTEGPLKDMPKRQIARGVVWLAINSAAPGKQGHGAAATRAGKDKYGMDYPILLDESGEVGHAYDAKTTPSAVVIDAKGNVVYRGAIDNAIDGDTQGEPFASYVEQALTAIASGASVKIKETKSYGCSVKYAKR